MTYIMSASYNPELHIFKCEDEDDSAFTFGFELEVDDRDVDYSNLGYDDSQDYVTNCLDGVLKILFGNDYANHELFYFKMDGSVLGFEIVSQPMTFKYFLENQEKFEQLLGQLKDDGFVSHKFGDCGLHFHIGNHALEENKVGFVWNDTQLEFCATNLNMIINYYKSELSVVSRRSQQAIDRWARFTDNDEFNFKKTYDKSKKYIKRNLKKRQGHSYPAERYHALNVTNRTTLEFRLLRGTLNWNTFFISFNLVNNLANAARLENKCVSWNDLYLSGLDDKMKAYAITYFDTQAKKPKWANLTFRNSSAIYTGENTFIRKMLLNQKLTELGVI